MEPDFTAFEFEKDFNPDGTVKPFNRKTTKLSLKVEWKEDGKAQANACLITAPDEQIWRVTAQRVEQN